MRQNCYFIICNMKVYCGKKLIVWLQKNIHFDLPRYTYIAKILWECLNDSLQINLNFADLSSKHIFRQINLLK